MVFKYARLSSSCIRKAEKKRNKQKTHTALIKCSRVETKADRKIMT